MKYLLKCALSKKNINENAPLPSNCSSTNATNEKKIVKIVISHFMD